MHQLCCDTLGNRHWIKRYRDALVKQLSRGDKEAEVTFNVTMQEAVAEDIFEGTIAYSPIHGYISVSREDVPLIKQDLPFGRWLVYKHPNGIVFNKNSFTELLT